jgi:hypothetical protein
MDIFQKYEDNRSLCTEQLINFAPGKFRSEAKELSNLTSLGD